MTTRRRAGHSPSVNLQSPGRRWCNSMSYSASAFNSASSTQSSRETPIDPQWKLDDAEDVLTVPLGPDKFSLAAGVTEGDVLRLGVGHRGQPGFGRKESFIFGHVHRTRPRLEIVSGQRRTLPSVSARPFRRARQNFAPAPMCGHGTNPSTHQGHNPWRSADG